MPKTLTETLANIRAVGFTPDRTAELFGVLRRQVYRWEAGERVPNLDLREQIETLGHTIDVLGQIYTDDQIMAWFLRLSMKGPGGHGIAPYRQLQAGRFDSVARAAERAVREALSEVAG